jgi:hypothetical protein
VLLPGARLVVQDHRGGYPGELVVGPLGPGAEAQDQVGLQRGYGLQVVAQRGAYRRNVLGLLPQVLRKTAAGSRSLLRGGCGLDAQAQGDRHQGRVEHDDAPGLSGHLRLA